MADVSFTRTRTEFTAGPASPGKPAWVGVSVSGEREVFGSQRIDAGWDQQTDLHNFARSRATSPAGMGVLVGDNTVPARSLAQHTPAEQADLKATVKQLSRDGKLFVQTRPDGPLDKVTGSAVPASLEENRGGLVYIVEAGKSHSSGHSSVANDQEFGYSGFASVSQDSNYIRDESSERHRNTQDYSATPIFSWKDVEWANTEGPALPASVTHLPGRAGSALVEASSTSHSFESWRTSYHSNLSDSHDGWSRQSTDWE